MIWCIDDAFLKFESFHFFCTKKLKYFTFFTRMTLAPSATTATSHTAFSHGTDDKHRNRDSRHIYNSGKNHIYNYNYCNHTDKKIYCSISYHSFGFSYLYVLYYMTLYHICTTFWILCTLTTCSNIHAICQMLLFTIYSYIHKLALCYIWRYTFLINLYVFFPANYMFVLVFLTIYIISSINDTPMIAVLLN